MKMNISYDKLKAQIIINSFIIFALLCGTIVVGIFVYRSDNTCSSIQAINFLFIPISAIIGFKMANRFSK